MNHAAYGNPLQHGFVPCNNNITVSVKHGTRKTNKHPSPIPTNDPDGPLVNQTPSISINGLRSGAMYAVNSVPQLLFQQQQQQPVPLYVTDNQVRTNDVLLGRGRPIVRNSGNMKFRSLIYKSKDEYNSDIKRSHKDMVARKVFHMITKKGGRFLRKVDDAEEIKTLNIPSHMEHVWVHVDITVALDKIKQTFRDIVRDGTHTMAHDERILQHQSLLNTDDDDDDDDDDGDSVAYEDLDESSIGVVVRDDSDRHLTVEQSLLSAVRLPAVGMQPASSGQKRDLSNIAGSFPAMQRNVDEKVGSTLLSHQVKNLVYLEHQRQLLIQEQQRQDLLQRRKEEFHIFSQLKPSNASINACNMSFPNIQPSDTSRLLLNVIRGHEQMGPGIDEYTLNMAQQQQYQHNLQNNYLLRRLAQVSSLTQSSAPFALVSATGNVPTSTSMNGTSYSTNRQNELDIIHLLKRQEQQHCRHELSQFTHGLNVDGRSTAQLLQQEQQSRFNKFVKQQNLTSTRNANLGEAWNASHPSQHQHFLHNSNAFGLSRSMQRGGNLNISSIGGVGNMASVVTNAAFAQNLGTDCESHGGKSSKNVEEIRETKDGDFKDSGDGNNHRKRKKAKRTN